MQDLLSSIVNPFFTTSKPVFDSSSFLHLSNHRIWRDGRRWVRILGVNIRAVWYRRCILVLKLTVDCNRTIVNVSCPVLFLQEPSASKYGESKVSRVHFAGCDVKYVYPIGICANTVISSKITLQKCLCIPHTRVSRSAFFIKPLNSAFF
jgi:hypothetical protein